MKPVFVTLSVMFLSTLGIAQPNPDTLWTRTYGGNEDEVAYSVQQTTDGGYIVAGSTRSFGAGYVDSYLVKTNAQGDTLWTQCYGGSEGDEAKCVRQTSDGGYIVVADTRRGIEVNEGDIHLIKTDADGNT
ncbi:hypothetical protein KJ815_06205, partial [bacterium]|nr:hypothetical protein [bacterium]